MKPNTTARRELRLRLRAVRRGISSEAHCAASAQAQSHVIAHPSFGAAEQIALYRAFDGEVDTAMLTNAASEQGKRVLHARISERHGLDFVEAESWSKTNYGLPIPNGRTHLLTDKDLLIVPGVGFDNDGYRIGFGGGHYDRLLADCTALPMGIAFECQRLDSVPRAPWDRPVAALATELGVVEFEHQETPQCMKQ